MKFKEERVNRSLDNIKCDITESLNNLYSAGYHDGRHDDRDKWSKSGYLIIDPEKLSEIKEILNNPPCNDCPFNTNGQFRVHCFRLLKGNEICNKYKHFLFLCELKEHFGKNS